MYNVPNYLLMNFWIDLVYFYPLLYATVVVLKSLLMANKSIFYNVVLHYILYCIICIKYNIV